MTRCTYRERWDGGPVMAGLFVLLVAGGLSLGGDAQARDLLAPKEQSVTEFEKTQAPSLDDQKRGVPQAMFVWIKMARGYEVEWDSFGRKGWYTQDPRIRPIDPGTTVFTPETDVFYVVFEVAPLEDPAQFSGQWFLEEETGKISETPVGRDTLEVPGHERYGFLELKKPAGGWPVGNYLVKVFITPLGQQPFHAVNQVGTMRFKIASQLPATVPAAQK